MRKKINPLKPRFYHLTAFLAGIFTLISCKPFGAIAASQKTDAAPPQVTQPALPAIYQSDYLNPLNAPHTYVGDTCQYLRNKWHPLNARPGTVVMIIMFKEISNPTEFTNIMTQLQAQGFEAINTKQFLAFMERNIYIPLRSALLIQDGNYEARNFDKYFRGYWDKFGWPVVNGWVSQPDMPESAWIENAQLEQEGWVDHQAQGVISDTILSDDSSKTVIARELNDSLTAFAKHYSKTPHAFIWPNGGFGLRPVQAARQLGYQLGFTSNPRGPVMYNWVPLADNIDPANPSYIPEGLIHDPLMTLPRYPAELALDAIDAVRASGEDATVYAEANKAAEFHYYHVVCEPSHGPIPLP